MEIQLEFWKKVDLSGIQQLLDSKCASIADTQLFSLKSRKALAVSTRQFNAESEKGNTKALLREYQVVIDALNSRAKVAEALVIDMHRRLSTVQDPVLWIEVELGSRSSSSHELRLKQELEEMKVSYEEEEHQLRRQIELMKDEEGVRTSRQEQRYLLDSPVLVVTDNDREMFERDRRKLESSLEALRGEVDDLKYEVGEVERINTTLSDAKNALIREIGELKYKMANIPEIETEETIVFDVQEPADSIVKEDNALDIARVKLSNLLEQAEEDQIRLMELQSEVDDSKALALGFESDIQRLQSDIQRLQTAEGSSIEELLVDRKDTSMTSILSAQRDRLRKRVDDSQRRINEYEDSERRLNDELANLRIENSNLYTRKNSGESIRYDTIDPFKSYRNSGTRRSGKVDKVTSMFVNIITASQTSRIILVVYILTLHVLVFAVLANRGSATITATRSTLHLVKNLK